MANNIRTDFLTFQESFLSEASPSRVDKDYGVVLRVILFYLWRGCSLSRTAGLKGKTEPIAALLSLSAYESILGFLQLLRMGYHMDAIVLARAVMERIAIVGYLSENRELIPRYHSGALSPYKDAIKWAKKKPISNWMLLYSAFSDVTHSRIVGPAGHLYNRTDISNAFRDSERPQSKDPDMTEELLSLVIYSLIALDPLALALIEDKVAQPFPNPTALLLTLNLDDFQEFTTFLQQFVTRYTT